MMAYRVLSKSTYHSVWCASLPMAAPCALFSRWTSRTLEGQKGCFETLTVAIIDSPTSRQSCQRRTLSLLGWSQHFGHQIWEEWRIWGEDVGKKKASYYITYHKFQHESTAKTAGTSHVPKSWASLLFKTIISACPRRNLFQICMDPLSGFPPVAFFRSIRKGIQHGRAGHARRKAA